MPTEIGSWSGVTSVPCFAVHGALVYNPTTDTWKVMLFGGGAEANNPPTGANDLRKSYLWDPATNTFSSQDFTLLGPTDLADPFCAHHCQLPDGRLLVMGGSYYGGPDGDGIRTAWIFDPVSESWSRADDMEFGRWYPTAVMLSDGKVLVASGRPATAAPIAEMEIFDPATETWSTLPGGANKALAIYPSLHLVPTGPHAGKVFYTGTRWAGGSGQNNWTPPDTALFDPVTNAWADLAPHVVGNRTEGFSVLLPPAECARVLVFGGGVTAPNGDPDSAEVIDLLAPNPQWVQVPDMHHDRTNVTGVILPNGRVFVFGGHDSYKWNASNGADRHVYVCEIYDPSTTGWVETAAMAVPRQYHSVGMLLPDGRVLCSGGVFPGASPRDQENMEIFSPPYMDELSRPTITSPLSSIDYGICFDIGTPESASIDKVVLIRPMAVTHHTDSEQRYVRLRFRVVNGSTLQVDSPDSGAIAPPGYYMLFLVNACGVPSVARFVRVGKPETKPVKEIKEFKEFKEFKEIKEFDILKEVKEIKEKDLKEKDKDKDKDLKEIKEKDLKEKDKDLKEIKEKDIFEGLQPLTHFIRPELRPDLTQATLRRERSAAPVVPPDQPKDLEVKNDDEHNDEDNDDKGKPR